MTSVREHKEKDSLSQRLITSIVVADSIGAVCWRDRLVAGVNAKLSGIWTGPEAAEHLIIAVLARCSASDNI